MTAIQPLHFLTLNKRINILNNRNLIIAGNFKKVSNNTYSNGNIFLTIGKRQKPQATKSRYYLLLHVDGVKKYMSSLYSKETDNTQISAVNTPITYEMDYQGIKYHLIPNEDSEGFLIEQVGIKRKLMDSNNIINLGVKIDPTFNKGKSKKGSV